MHIHTYMHTGDMNQLMQNTYILTDIYRHTANRQTDKQTITYALQLNLTHL